MYNLLLLSIEALNFSLGLRVDFMNVPSSLILCLFLPTIQQFAKVFTQNVTTL